MAARERHVEDTVLLVDGTDTESEFRIEVATVADFVAHRDVWRPALAQLGALDSAWDWLSDFRTEEEAPHRESYGLRRPGGRVQGLISLEFRATLVYVERLAIAPWNRFKVTGRTDLVEAKGVGAALLMHAARRSESVGTGGAVGLHSLEDEGTIYFYSKKMKMTERGRELVDGEMLRYFEWPRVGDVDALQCDGGGEK